jgi:hypothetical protein
MVPQLLVRAHGLGGAKDLPVPAALAILGGVAALLVSFAVLALAWREPRYDAKAQGRRAPAVLARVVDSPAWSRSLRVLGLLFFGYVGWALVAGPDLVTNPVFGTFYVLVWVGLVPASLLFGPVVRAVSPVRTVGTVLLRLRGSTDGFCRYPERLGLWPAAFGLLAFVWQELVNPQSAYLGPVRVWLAGYVAVMLLGGVVFGERWFARADPFEVYSTLVAHLSVWGRRGRVLVVRSPLASLDAVAPRPGLVAVVAVLFGSTAFDSFKDSTRWVGVVDRLGHPVLVDSAALLVSCLLVGASFTVAARCPGLPRRAAATVPRAALPRWFAHSVVPIIVGYITAHYLSYFVEQGQTTIRQLSDPMVDGADLLGTAGMGVSYWLSFHPGLLATAKVLAVVAGHVVGVVAAHDRALRVLPLRHRVTGQVALLAVMVCYTAGGLYLLFGS